jgi:hypothetical protein
MRRHKSLISTIKRRVALRRTKSDQFLEIRDMPIKRVISEMDDFFNRFKNIQELYKKLRIEHTRYSSIKLLSEIDKTKKGFVRAVSLIRTFRDSLPKWDNDNNLVLAKELFDRGYQEEAYIMCRSLGVEYHDYFAPIKVRRETPKRKKPLLTKEALKILERNNPKLKKEEPKVFEGEQVRYYMFVNHDDNYVVHDRWLSKNVWLPTHIFKCVVIPRQGKATFTPERPRAGQIVVSKDGTWLQIKSYRKQNKIVFHKDEKAQIRLKKKQERVKAKRDEERRLQKEKERAEKRQKRWDDLLKRNEIWKKQQKKEKRLAKIAEEQRLKKEQLQLEKEEQEKNKPLTYKQLIQIRGNKPRKFGVKLTGIE